jgi:hypothetical protein
MEDLLAIEAETKFLLTASDHSYEQTLMQELLRIFQEAEILFGPRDASFQLSDNNKGEKMSPDKTSLTSEQKSGHAPGKTLRALPEKSDFSVQQRRACWTTFRVS